MTIRIGVLTAGGDAPGLNAAIRAVVRSSSTCSVTNHCRKTWLA